MRGFLLLLFCASASLLLPAPVAPRHSHFRRLLGNLTRTIHMGALKTGGPVYRDCPRRPFSFVWRPSPDAHLSTPELIEKYGYPMETHHVTTKDGYILTLFRIPRGKRQGRVGAKRPVVLLMHGIFQTSADWLMNPEHKCLPYILANAGYDVWLGNARGNSYSNKHVTLTTRDLEYWKFSWHEMGFYDIPATIDHILGVTKEKQVNYIGHSMGTTAFWVAMSTRPEYNAKIRLMVALGPIAFLAHLKPLGLVAPFTAHVEKIYDLATNGKFLWMWAVNLMHGAGPLFCAPSPFPFTLCGALLFIISGFDPCQFRSTEQISKIAGHFPDMTSSRTVLHYLQLKQSRRFARYDHGETSNRAIYGPGHSHPPSYNLSAITAPVAVYWGQNDYVAARRDVAHLVRHLPNVVANGRVNLWSHFDFTYGYHVDSLVYDHVIQLIRKYEKGRPLHFKRSNL